MSWTLIEEPVWSNAHPQVRRARKCQSRHLRWPHHGLQLARLGSVHEPSVDNEAEAARPTRARASSTGCQTLLCVVLAALATSLYASSTQFVSAARACPRSGGESKNTCFRRARASARRRVRRVGQAPPADLDPRLACRRVTSPAAAANRHTARTPCQPPPCP